MCQVGLNPKPHCPNMWWRDLRELMPRRGGGHGSLNPLSQLFSRVLEVRHGGGAPRFLMPYLFLPSLPCPRPRQLLRRWASRQQQACWRCRTPQ